MALTRKFLKAMGIEDDVIGEIIAAHTETTNGLIEERDRYKADAEKLEAVTKERDELKADAAKYGGKDPWKVKYEALKEDFDAYKEDVTAKESRAKKSDAYKAMLQKAGVSENRLNAVLRVSDVDSVELDENGKIKDEDKLIESVKTEWSDFIETVQKKGANPSNPPSNNGARMTIEQIDAIEDDAERQAAMAANLDLYGIN